MNETDKNTIPRSAFEGAAKVAKRNRWPMPDIPTAGIEVVTGGHQPTYKPGLRAWIIGGEGRTVFLGESLTETIVGEFRLILENGAIFYGQMGRDFLFIDPKQ